MDTEKLIGIATDRLNSVRIDNWNPEWLKEVNTAALIAIAQELQGIHQELKRANDNTEVEQEYQEEWAERQRMIDLYSGE